MTELIRVLVADDHYVVRQGLAALLVPRNGMEVVGEAATGREAVENYRDLRPDVVLMDMVMPEMTGPEAIAEIVAAAPTARILVLTSFGEEGMVTDAIEAGALGYLLKDASPDDLIHAIHSVHRGHMVVPKDLALGLLSTPAEKVQRDDLTERERAVLRLLAAGLTNREIAKDLHIGTTTVRSHVSRILAKLDAANRTQAALIAKERGLV